MCPTHALNNEILSGENFFSSFCFTYVRRYAFFCTFSDKKEAGENLIRFRAHESTYRYEFYYQLMIYAR